MSTPSETEWEACPQGKLQQTARRMRNRKRQSAFAQTGSLLAAAFLAFGAVYWLTQTPGDLECDQVASHLKAYVDGEVGEPKLEEQIRVHLLNCPHCRQKYERLKNEKNEKRTVTQVFPFFLKQLVQSSPPSH